VLVEATVRINRPPAEVFAFVADQRNDPRWRAGVVEMTPSPPAPVAPGTTVHEVLRFAGRTHVTDTTIVDVVPGRSFEFAGAGSGGRVRGSRAVAPTSDGTQLTTRLQVDTSGLLRLLEPVLAPRFRAATRRDLATLARLLEQASDDDQTATTSRSETANAASSMRR
jgi:uncharacterized protein YndB with AHSA1/START domain